MNLLLAAFFLLAQTSSYDLENRRAWSQDGLGRLIEVRQYLDLTTAAADSAFSLPTTHSSLLLTRYSFDELGNQLTQTDARGHTTHYRYDSLGRRTTRILPDNATETLQYDEWGNLWKRTDFAGQTTTFGYDNLNRLKSKTADASHPSLIYSHAIARVEYDYDASGARTAARTYNASNTALYTETTPRDIRGRLDAKITTLGTLSYRYYDNGLLQDVVSSNAGGLNTVFRYDEANRLAFVDDASQLPGSPIRTTSYTYNANGSLATMTAPNGLTHSYAYDSLNRLRSLSLTKGVASLQAYTYSLNPSGHRRVISEATGRTATHTYDGLYRLTGETIAGAPGQNGTVAYTLDKVGNREARTVSGLLATHYSLPATNSSFNARDWLNSDTYDANGNTRTTSLDSGFGIPSAPDTYDFEDRLIIRRQPDGRTVNLSYDADGIRRQKTIFNVTAQLVSATGYLIDTNNHTGYAQVVEEYQNTATGVTAKVYTYGTDLIAQTTTAGSSPPATHYYQYDGLGSVRFLTNAAGLATDSYDYDAFGNLTARTGTTENAYLYRGEQFDADVGMYSLRARFYNQATGRFWNQDTYEGSASDPASLHKYLYAHADPVGMIDPSGHMSMTEVGFVTFGVGILAKLTSIGIQQFGGSSAAANRADGLARAALAVSTMLFLPHPGVVATASDEASAGLRQVFSGKRENTVVASSVLALGGSQSSAELASAATQVVGTFGPQLMAKAAELQSFTNAMYGQFVGGRGGAIVLGRYPDYINQANAVGANALNVPPWLYKLADKMPGGFWSWLNRPFLESTIARGDRILLSNGVPAAAPLPGAGGQGLWNEIQYLHSRGYRPTGVGSAANEMKVTMEQVH